MDKQHRLQRVHGCGHCGVSEAFHLGSVWVRGPFWLVYVDCMQQWTFGQVAGDRPVAACAALVVRLANNCRHDCRTARPTVCVGQLRTSMLCLGSNCMQLEAHTPRLKCFLWLIMTSYTTGLTGCHWHDKAKEHPAWTAHQTGQPAVAVPICSVAQHTHRMQAMQHARLWAAQQAKSCGQHTAAAAYGLQVQVALEQQLQGLGRGLTNSID